MASEDKNSPILPGEEELKKLEIKIEGLKKKSPFLWAKDDGSPLEPYLKGLRDKDLDTRSYKSTSDPAMRSS